MPPATQPKRQTRVLDIRTGDHVLVLTGKGRKTHAEGNLPEGTRVFPDLAAFAEHLAP